VNTPDRTLRAPAAVADALAAALGLWPVAQAAGLCGGCAGDPDFEPILDVR